MADTGDIDMDESSGVVLAASSLTQRLALACNEAVAELERERAALAADRLTLVQDKEAWAACATHLADVNRAFGEKVTLNVGGQTFVTTLSTLRRVHNSFFAQMFSGRWHIPSTSTASSTATADAAAATTAVTTTTAAPESSREIFIDRDPTMFRHILNFMRGIVPDVSLFSQLEQQALKAEAGYYMLTELEQLLEVLEEVDVFSELGGGAAASSLYPHIVDVTLSSSGGNRSFGDVLDTRNTRALENRYHDPETPWMCFAFGTVRVRPTRYAVRQDEDHFLRNWVLQGSNDGNNWTNLREHTNDDTISNRSRTGLFTVPTDHGYFSRLRILLTGPSHKGERNFDICNVQFWGYIEEQTVARTRKRQRMRGQNDNTPSLPGLVIGLPSSSTSNAPTTTATATAAASTASATTADASEGTDRIRFGVLH